MTDDLIGWLNGFCNKGGVSLVGGCLPVSYTARHVLLLFLIPVRRDTTSVIFYFYPNLRQKYV